jgi:hypothetical protein
MYFVIRNSEGYTRIDRIDREELERRLSEHWYGEHVRFLATIPDSDSNNWPDPESDILIIKGEIVTPTPQEVVMRYVVD